MSNIIVWILIGIHAMYCIAFFTLRMMRIAQAPMALIPVVVFVPVFGILCALYAEWTSRSKHMGTKPTRVESFIQSESVYNKINVDEGDKPAVVVPLEEAILINDVQTRRNVMIDILHRDPSQYLELLKVARLNEDVEVTHYATTTIIEIQRDFELAIQKQSTITRNNPSDIEALDVYINTLGKYINSGLIDGHILTKQRMLYMSSLQRKIELDPNDKDAYFNVIENEIALQRFPLAEKALETLIKNWPDDENVWLAGIRIYMESNNKALKSIMLEEMKKLPIKWTAKGKEKMRFLYGADQFASMVEM